MVTDLMAQIHDDLASRPARESEFVRADLGADCRLKIRSIAGLDLITLSVEVSHGIEPGVGTTFPLSIPVARRLARQLLEMAEFSESTQD